jgi:hypothetical protein
MALLLKRQVIVKELADGTVVPVKPAGTHGLGVEETHGRRVLDRGHRAG